MLSKMYVLTQFAILTFILLNSARMMFRVPEQSLINILRQLACAIAQQFNIWPHPVLSDIHIYLRNQPLRQL